jgi:hypothetical protein
MNPLQEGLRKYHQFHLPLGYSDLAGGSQYVMPGSLPDYSQSTIYRDGNPKKRGRPRKQVDGGINMNDVKEVAKKVGVALAPVAKKYAPQALDATFDLGAKALAVPLSEVIGPAAPIVTKLASQLARSAVKKKFGYGAKTKRPAPVQKPQSAKRLMEPMLVNKLEGHGRKPAKKTAAKKTAAKTKPKMSENNDIGVYDGGFQKKKAQTKKQSNGMDKRKQRGELIKKIMKERNVNLATASKIIKQESLI